MSETIPDDERMTDAEFAMVRGFLGLTGEDLAARLGVTLRTVRRWEHGHSPIPEGVRLEMESLESVAATQVSGLIASLLDSPDVELRIPRDGTAEWPARWWRMVAARCAQEVPGLSVRYEWRP